ncbi:MAG TPA: isoleucine--tRNA ligase [Planctomycetota bacterium]|nr:isoleucine--tRNA ligase [Planctomycetota bacterium]
MKERAAAFREVGESELRDADAFERPILERWRASDLFGATLAARAGAPPFVFYEGPPTANGRPGIHHVLSRTLKDVVCRYRTMKGRRVLRKAGWDTHGLPVEIEVEKSLGLSGKGEIETFGIGEFNRLCRESVFRHKEEWERLSERIGYWLDYRDPYMTCSNAYVESVWYLLSRFHAAGLLYRGRKVIPFCPRCGTGLSSHEVGLGYKDATDPSVTVLFPIAGAQGRYLAAWTTTPWTLPSNVALAVHPRLRYARVRRGGKEFVAARGRLASLFPAGDFEVIEECDGAALAGTRYEPLFPIDRLPRLPTGTWTPSETNAHRVYAAEFVSAEEGTGIVHVAPAYGPDDHALAAREALPVVAAVGSDGRFAEGGPVPAGTFFKEADPLLLADLKGRGLLLRRDQVEHAYPFCWRCDTPLFYFATPAWFLRTTSYREALVEFNRRIRWVPPEVGTGRFGDWLEGNVDWAISRERYWGTPLPIWVCDRDEGHVEVFGSVGGLGKRAGSLPRDLDLHRPAVDGISFRCGTCAGSMRRVASVLDCWFDSGAMPFGQFHWPFENRDRVREQFPADYIAEGLDQTRGWFYTLHAIATFLTGVDRARGEEDPALALPEGSAYRTCLVNGLVLDREGKKMSKRLGNALDPWEAIRRDGADAVRWYLLSTSAPWLPKRFDPDGVSDVRHGFLRKVADSYNFFARYANVEGWSPGSKGGAAELLDRWIASRSASTVLAVDGALEAYDLTGACRAIERFVVEELSNWYIRRSRERFWRGGEGARGAFATLHAALETTCRLLAPFAPFLADEVYRRVRGEAESAHLAPFPKADPAAREPGLEAAMDVVLRVCRMGHALRERARRRVRQPLRRLRVWVGAGDPSALRDEAFAALVREELNVKEILPTEGFPVEMALRAKPNYAVVGKKLGGRVKVLERKLAEADRDLVGVLWGLRSGTPARMSLSLDGVTADILPEDLRFTIEAPPGTSVEAEGDLVVALETEVTEDLLLEGLARELVSRIQSLRKDGGLDLSDRIRVDVRGDAGDLVRRALEAHGAVVRGETLAEGGIRFASGDGEGWSEFELPDGAGRVALRIERAVRSRT